MCHFCVSVMRCTFMRRRMDVLIQALSCTTLPLNYTLYFLTLDDRFMTGSVLFLIHLLFHLSLVHCIRWRNYTFCIKCFRFKDLNWFTNTWFLVISLSGSCLKELFTLKYINKWKVMRAAMITQSTIIYYQLFW